MNPTFEPEILAPVGNMEMAQAAVHNGAHAIYVGTPGFNARGRTKDHTLEELKEIIDFCHLYDVKVLLALNILVFERELDILQSYLPEVLKLQPDAFIVQDLGLAKLLKERCPELPLHASTQMTLASAEAVEELADFGFKRLVLARELSLDQIQSIRESTKQELEVFVHGALCVSYSGQCLTSESFGGRSANRGQCAQSCRLEYELLVDGKVKPLKDNARYLFSPQDLCGIEEVPQLKAMGVDTFKIEGRLKTPQYVANTVSHFAKAIEGKNFDKEDLSKTYSRGFYSGWLNGVAHQELATGVSSSHLGERLGQITRVSRFEVEILGSKGLAPGDGILLRSADHLQEVAGPLYELEDLGKKKVLRFANDLDLSQVQKGWWAFRNSNPKANKELTHSYELRENKKRIPIDVSISLNEGNYLELYWTDPDFRTVYAQSKAPIEPAKKAGLKEEKAFKELNGLADTAYSMADFSFQIEGDWFVPNSVLRKLKQDCISQLNQQRQDRHKYHWKDFTQQDLPVSLTSNPQVLFSILVRKESQLNDLAELPIDTIYMDFEFGKDYKFGLEKIRKLGYKAGIATLRVFKPREQIHLKVIEHLKPDAVLVRNLGALNYLKDSGLKLVGDHSLNITNSWSANWYLNRGLEIISPGHDLNAVQLEDMLVKSRADQFEMTLHHYMPSFHMEHCVFAAFLSDGNSYKDCGKPCEQHKVEVRDHKGAVHYLAPDQECRNTMYNGTPQSSIGLLKKVKELGLHQFRIEALLEEPGFLRKKVETYAKFLAGEMEVEQVHSELGVEEKYGIAEGQLFNLSTYEDRKKA